MLGAPLLAVQTSASAPLLMRHPTVNATSVVFAFAGDLWSVPRAGGDATRLTSAPGTESNPCFSPDGSTVAFTGQYDGNTDVFTVPAKGGVPKRLTYHPGADQAVGWTPDGKAVVFSSAMLSNTDLPRLFTVPAAGGVPKALPFPSGTMASFSPDGKRLAYVPQIHWQQAWKRYRGGQAYKIWLGDLADSKVKPIPTKDWNDYEPMWVGSKVYFLSDRTGPVGLYAYDGGSGKVETVVPGAGLDIKSAGASTGSGAGAIVYEKLGSIHLVDLATKKDRTLDISVQGDFPEVRTGFKRLAPYATNGRLSPSGSRAVFEARGRIFTVPAAKGDVRDLTGKDGVAERSPAWSPDAKTIAYLSDESGEYRLVLRDAAAGTERALGLGEPPAFYLSLAWSPDSKKIAYTDNRHNLWCLDVASGASTKVDTAVYEDPTRSTTPAWSPDSKWIAWHRDLESHLNAVFLYGLDTGKKTQVTDGLSNARYPVFDTGGKYLFFVASTNTATGTAWLDLSSYNSLNNVSSVYAITLAKETPDPLAPESDEEKAPEKPAAPSTDKTTKIDLDGMDARTIALPVPAGNYVQVMAAGPGTILATVINAVARVTDPARPTVWRFSFATRSATPFAQGASVDDVTPDGSKALLTGPAGPQIVPTVAPPAPGQGRLDLGGMTARIDPRKEWRQMYHETWRIERDFLYDPHHHGVDLEAMERRYEPFLDGLASRADLNYLFEDMLGEISIGHMFVGGGDVPGVAGVPGGLLGADYAFENGHYRLTKVYSGEGWNPGVRGPLSGPGIDAKAGEYLLAIDGKPLTDSNDVYEALEGKAGRQVRVRIGPTPDGAGAREVTVVPVPNESALRNLAWEEDNRRTVERLSGGKLGYVHVPDTNLGGWTNFNRFYYAQIRRAGMVIDERFNHGGQVDDYMVEAMNRPLMSMWTSRYGADFASPASANFGPKVLIINEFAGSGGDYFPWHFRKAGVGPLIGKRTWGGLVGILPVPGLIDGGSVRAPNVAFYNPNGTWEIENHGVDPDIEVELDPAKWRSGHDAQLEAAVAEAMRLVSKTPPPTVKKPAYPDRTKVGVKY